MIALDCETTGLDWHKDALILVGMAGASGAREVAPDALSSYSEAVWHNWKLDAKVLGRLGYSAPFTDDTLIMASLLPIPPDIGLDLESLAIHFLHFKPWKLNFKRGKQYTREQILEHCLNDCKAIYGLHEEFKERLSREGQWAYYRKYAIPLHRLLTEVERHGIRVDFAQVRELQSILSKELAELDVSLRTRWQQEFETVSRQYNLLKIKPPLPCTYYRKGNVIKSEKQHARIKNKEGWLTEHGIMPSQTHKNALQRESIEKSPPPLNLNSPTQLRALLEFLGVFLYDQQGKATTNRHEMEYSINEHPILKEILEYRDKVKQLSFLTSWDGYNVDGRIHTNYNMAGRADNGKWKRGVRTRRLSSSEPNLQQIDTRMRSLFVPDDGCVFVGGDFSQIEMRLIAHFCEDNRMRDIFRKGKDFYGAVAVDMFGLSCHPNEVAERDPEKRQIAKMISLAIPYGMWAPSLAYRAKLAGIALDEDGARDYLNGWYDIYRGVRAYKIQLGKFALAKGYVRSIYGSKIWIPREEAEHKALDYRCQSSGHEMTAFPQLGIQAEVQEFARPSFWLHDEIRYNCRNDSACIQTLTELMLQRMVVRQIDILKLTVPLELQIIVSTNLQKK